MPRPIEYSIASARAFPAFWPGYYAAGSDETHARAICPGGDEFGQISRRCAHDIKAAQLIATAALKQRAAERAIEYLKPFADKSPADAATLAILGNAYMADRKPDLALQQFQKIAALDPDNPAIKTQIGISEIDAGQRATGPCHARAGVWHRGRRADCWTHARADGTAGTASLDKAAEVAARLIKRDAKNPIYQTLLGEVRLAQQDYSAAESAFRAALAINPDFTAATRDLAQLFAATGRADEARNSTTICLQRTR